ncbi:hypothetical protein PPYR_08810 [Photinus pyralis]|uniref:Golgin subfamily A conserved domain-containing protein n=1 Tax=Photinus pyralis TaxID=7054 RepID=A0A1Y1LQ73_PHOPY|nr:golgin subfamily A member 2-like [Photinus pyralis]KAB0797817.1 hypothetical protein PPYR_08810 [Photinus pyralis]
MADATKSQKLAAAKKKLKEYQQKSKKPETGEENLHTNDALSNSTHSSINGGFDIVPLETVSTNIGDTNQRSPFQNYFNPERQNVVTEQKDFFDSLSFQTNTNHPPISNVQDSHINAIFNEKHSDPGSLEYPELTESKPYGVYTEKPVDHPFVSFEDARKLSDYMTDATNGVEEIVPAEKSLVNSNIESLRQLSSEINELIKVEPDTHDDSDLERRNVELARLLDQECLVSHTARNQLRESQSQVEQLQCECQQIKTDYEHRLNREVGPLQEQLQCHAQTVGILIAEKTELSSALSQAQFLAKQKVSECEELQGRLKTSRSRVADLERDLQMLKAEKQKYESGNVYEEEIQKWKRDYEDLTGRYEEVSQDFLETKEKLNLKNKENLDLQREVQDAKHHLSLAKVKIEQITTGGNLLAESQVEALTQQKIMLEKQVLEFSQALKATTEERDQASVQYQHYVQQLNGQITSLAQKLENLTTENESLNKRESNFVHHISELEKHLQKLQEDQLNAANSCSATSDVRKELEAVTETLQSLQIDRDKLEECYNDVVSERDELLRDSEYKKECIEKLESQMENLQSDQPDNAKLLHAIESDKIAASRAVEQNTQLKQQLEEMQQAFVRMSNDKLDLTERLTSEEYHNKELHEKLTHTEHQLHTLSEAIAIKDGELTHMRDTLALQNKQILQHDQLNDRLRHYEAQDGSSNALQNELQQAQHLIEHLSKENQTLREEASKITDSIQDQLRSERLQLLSQSNPDILNIEVGSQTVSDVDDSKSVDLSTLDKEAAMKHLEDKFTRTMADIANLTEEKQRLEHIVMQLQDETETIGEYIALYQHQRGILQQRTQEKDDQLKRLAYDRETVKRKLDALNELVKRLMLEKGALSPEFLEHHKMAMEKQELCTEHAKIHEDMHKIPEHNVNCENNNLQQNTGMAEEIIALLADIKTSNLIQPKESLENFHPCAWCSGQLITV